MMSSLCTGRKLFEIRGLIFHIADPTLGHLWRSACQCVVGKLGVLNPNVNRSEDSWHEQTYRSLAKGTVLLELHRLQTKVNRLFSM